MHNVDLSESAVLQLYGKEISPEKLPQNSSVAHSPSSATSSTPVRPCQDVSVRPKICNRPPMCNNLSATQRTDEIPQSSWPGISPEKLPLNISAIQTHPQNCIEQEGINVNTQVPQNQRSLNHSSSCPEQRQFLTNGPVSDPGSTFGIRPLVSTDIPGLGYNPLSHLMSEPNSSDMGPTILSPSISLQDASNHNSQAPTRDGGIHPVLSPSGTLPEASNHGSSQVHIQRGGMGIHPVASKSGKYFL